MNIWGCLSFYNDGYDILKRCLDSLKKNGINKLIAIDGPYLGFPIAKHQTFESHPRMVELVKKYADIFIPGRQWISQVAKRNQYLKKVPNGEYLFIIDADERLMNKVDTDKLKTRDFWNIQMHRPLKPQWGDIRYNRFYKKYPDLEYVAKHCALYYTDYCIEGELYAGLVSRLRNLAFALDVDGKKIIVNHYAEGRNKLYKKQRKAYAYAKKDLHKEPKIQKWNMNSDMKNRDDYIRFAKAKGWIKENHIN